MDNTTGTAIWKYSGGTEMEYFNLATNEASGYPDCLVLHYLSIGTAMYAAPSNDYNLATFQITH